MVAAKIKLAAVLGGALLAFPSLAQASPTLSLRAAAQASDDGGRGHRAMLVLTLPLEGAVAPDLRVAALAQDSAAEAEPSAVRRALAASPGCALTPRFARATVRAARRAVGSRRTWARLNGLASRAKVSAYLPELRLSAERSYDESLRLTPTQSDPYRFTQAGGTTTSFEARMTWRLDRLVFAHDELAVERLRAAHAGSELALGRRVLEALFAWQRGLAVAAATDRLEDERLEGELSAEQAAATLDVLTDGWFGPRASARLRACSG